MPNKEIIATLEKPYTENQRMDFIVEYNHNQGCEIEELEDKTLQAFEMVKTPEELAQEERERLDMLSMTRGDVFEALILAKGLTKPQIRAMIEQAELDTVTKALYLNRFDEALEFYRGYPIFDMLWQALRISSEMLDKFFETKDYHYLTTCKLTINAMPTEAIVAGAGSYPYGTLVDYKVELEGYKPYIGSIELLKDTELNIELEKIEEVVDENTTDTTTDANNEDEVEAEPTGEVNKK